LVKKVGILRVKLSFLLSRLAKEEVILPLFLICFGYSAPSVFITLAACECGMREYLFCVLLCAPVLHQATNETLIVPVFGIRRPEFFWRVQAQQRCQLNLPGLCVTAVVNKDYQLKSVTVTLHSHRHSIKVTKLDPHAPIRPTSEICPMSRFFGGYN
jgi:hypothetical protein